MTRPARRVPLRSAGAALVTLSLGVLASCSDDDGLVLDGPAEVDTTDAPLVTQPVVEDGGGGFVGGTGTLTASVGGVEFTADATICEITPTALVAEGSGTAADGTQARISITRTPGAAGDDVSVAVVVGAGSPAWSVTSASAGAGLAVEVGEAGLSGSGPATDISDPTAPARPLEFSVTCDS